MRLRDTPSETTASNGSEAQKCPIRNAGTEIVVYGRGQRPKLVAVEGTVNCFKAVM